MKLPEETYTIEEFVSSRNKNLITYDKLCIFEKDGDTTLITHNVLNDYKDEILNAASILILSQEEYDTYRFKPKLLSYRLYGTTELYFLLLLLNNIASVKEFDFKKLKIIENDYISELLSSIYNAESSTLTDNRNKIQV